MIFVELQTVSDLMTFMPFLNEGLEAGNKYQVREEHHISSEQFLKQLLQVVARPEDDRLILLATKDNKPVGFIINFRASKPFVERRIVHCYMAYATNDCSNIMTGLLSYGVDWAKRHGYKEITCQTARNSGAAWRLFEKRWKFERVATVFSRMI